jgi:hypothetical protein
VLRRTTANRLRLSRNLDAFWARIAVELDEAKLVQLDRLRVGPQGLRLRELADQFGHAGRMIIESIVKTRYEESDGSTRRNREFP